MPSYGDFEMRVLGHVLILVKVGFQILKMKPVTT
jgi:hypothetical protein